MNFSRIIALFAWINVFALSWVMILYPSVSENKGIVIVVWIVFGVIAFAASISSEGKKSE